MSFSIQGYFNRDLHYQPFYVIIKNLKGFSKSFVQSENLLSIVKCPVSHSKRVGFDFRLVCWISVPEQVIGLPMSTSYTFHSSTKGGVFNQVIKFPIKINELPDDSRLNFHAIDVVFPEKETVFATGSVEIYKEKVVLNQGDVSLDMIMISNGEEAEKLTLEIELPQFNGPVVYVSSSIKKKCYFSQGVHAPEKVILDIRNKVDFHESQVSIEQFSPTIEKAYALRLGKDERYTLKTESAELKVLQEVGKKTPLQTLSPNEKLLIWKHRDKIKNDPLFQVKILECVEWKNSRVVEIAKEIIESWKLMPLPNILEILSYKFKGEYVPRDTAVKFLEKINDDEEILEIVMQLVQSLKYETRKIDESPLLLYLISKSLKSIKYATSVYWHLRCDPSFLSVSEIFLKKIRTEKDLYESIKNQVKLMDVLKEMHSGITSHSQEVVRELFKTYHKKLKKIFPLHLPVDPNIRVSGIEYSKINVFKSGSFPLLIPFKMSKGDLYYAIYKEGDDLRQDQMVVNILRILSRVLLENSVKEKKRILTAYKVVCTGINCGLIECVRPSTSLHKILKEQMTPIRQWLSDRNTTLLSYQNSLQLYIKTTAVYTMITYVLGIGDRHLDNILIQDDGKVFHVDFGYILGARQFFEIHKPQIKLNKGMIDGLGGIDSGDYKTFLIECCNTYKVARMNSKIIVSMFLMMVDSGIKDIQQFDRQDGKKQSIRSINKIMLVQERLKVNFDDNVARTYLVQRILENISTFGGRVEDFTHWLAMRYLRK